MAIPENTIDRRTLLKIVGAAGAWPVLSPAAGDAQAGVNPFKIHVSNEELADLRRRLSNIRWPPAATGKPWSMGTDRAYLEQLMAYWKDNTTGARRKPPSTPSTITRRRSTDS